MKDSKISFKALSSIETILDKELDLNINSDNTPKVKLASYGGGRNVNTSDDIDALNIRLKFLEDLLLTKYINKYLDKKYDTRRINNEQPCKL